MAAALTVLALCAYSADREIGLEMLNFLRGPRPLNGQEISFLNDRFRDGKTYLPFTYFAGSTADNNYTPTRPYTIRVESNHTSHVEQGSGLYETVYPLRRGRYTSSHQAAPEGKRWQMVSLGTISADRCPYS